MLKDFWKVFGNEFWEIKRYMKRQVVFWSGFLGALLFAITSIVGGLQIEEYNFISQFISESYATGVPNSEYLRKLFVISGVLLTLFGISVPIALKTTKSIKVSFFLFAIFYGLGTVTTGFFPCDYGCPTDSEVSLSQFIHNTIGFLIYAIVPFCLIGVGLASKKLLDLSKLSKVSLVCGTLAIVFVILLFGNPQGPFIGVFQRIIEGSILFWVMYTALYIRNIKNHSA